MEVRESLAIFQKNAAGRAVQAEGAGFRGRGSGVHFLAAQVGLDARHQLARAEGLGDVIVAADFETQHAVHFFGARREKHHRSARQHGGLADLAAQLEAVDVGQHDVEHDEIRLAFLQGLQGSLGSAENLGLITVAGKVVVQQRGEFGLVLHDGDSLGHAVPL